MGSIRGGRAVDRIREGNVVALGRARQEFRRPPSGVVRTSYVVRRMSYVVRRTIRRDTRLRRVLVLIPGTAKGTTRNLDSNVSSRSCVSFHLVSAAESA